MGISAPMGRHEEKRTRPHGWKVLATGHDGAKNNPHKCWKISWRALKTCVSNTKKKGKNQAKPFFPFEKKKNLNNTHRKKKGNVSPIYSGRGRRVLSLSFDFLF